MRNSKKNFIWPLFMDRLQPSLGCRATTSVKFYFDTHLKTSENQRLKLTRFKPVIHFDAPENIRKTKVFWCFQGYQNGSLAWNGLILTAELLVLIWSRKDERFSCSWSQPSLTTLTNAKAFRTIKIPSWLRQSSKICIGIFQLLFHLGYSFASR